MHFGSVQSWRGQERLADTLAGRLRWMLYRETGLESMRHVVFEEAACWAGTGDRPCACRRGRPSCSPHARAALQRLARFEMKFGRKRVGNRYTRRIESSSHGKVGDK